MARVRASPRRGDVYWVGLDPAVGTEIKKTRPAVVISNDSCNTYGTRVVVVPVAGNVDTLFPGEALIEVKGQTARVLGDQIRSLDKVRLRSRIGRLTAVEMAAVEEAVRITLGFGLLKPPTSTL